MTRYATELQKKKIKYTCTTHAKKCHIRKNPQAHTHGRMTIFTTSGALVLLLLCTNVPVYHLFRIVFHILVYYSFFYVFRPFACPCFDVFFARICVMVNEYEFLPRVFSMCTYTFYPLFKSLTNMIYTRNALRCDTL